MVAFAVERARLERRQMEVAEIYAELGLQPQSVELVGPSGVRRLDAAHQMGKDSFLRGGTLRET
jgi:hypothetical protein